ncbi:MAG: DUF2235 domain-containing protein [Pseudomonadota bacterium]
MPRNLIICLDGTNNRIGDHQTNIIRFFRGLSHTDTQIPYYAQGIGTVRSQDVREKEPISERVRGMAFGAGLESIVLDAYRFLCSTYDFSARRDEQKRDRLYFFGFSRGAYAARMLAGFINEFGLLEPNSLHIAVQVFREYLALVDVEDDVPARERYLALRRYSGVFHPKAAPIEGLVLFDTVASIIRWGNVGRNWREYRSPIQLARHPSTSKNPTVRFVLHALAVDEKRTFFRPLLWQERENQAELDDPVKAWNDGKGSDVQLYFGNRFRRSTPEKQIVRQVWFPGVHGDIGGSAREDEAGLGKITACWVYDQLQELAPTLQYRKGFYDRYLTGSSDSVTHSEDGRRISKPDFDARIHPSLKGKWAFAELIPKSKKRREPPEDITGWWPYYQPNGERRYIKPGALVHRSVFDRKELGSRTYNPPALKDANRKDYSPNDHPALHNPSYPAPAEGSGGS